MEHKVVIHNGKVHKMIEVGGEPNESPDIIEAAKEQLVKMYCGDGYPNSCEVLSCQLEDPSNEGRVYTVNI